MKDHGAAPKREWKYTPPTKEGVKRQHDKRGGDFDSIFADGIATWPCKEGDHKIRILPATWPDPEHFGRELWLHYGIGADNQKYLCAFKMKDEPCSLCKAGHKPKKVIAYFIIDRKSEGDGPKIWVVGWTINRDITGIMADDSGETLSIDSLKQGYDLNFSRTGMDKDNTKYHSFRFSRHPTPISDDPDTYRKWKQFIIDHPIPEVTLFHPGDYMMKVYNGGVSEMGTATDDDDAPPKTRSGAAKPPVDDDDDAPAPKKSADPLDDDEDDAPAPTAKKSRPVVEDDDEDEPAPKPKAKKPAPVEDDEDEDEPAPKAKPKPAPSDDDDEDEAPVAKPKGSDKIREAARKAIEDDDEDEPAPKPKAKKPAPVEDDEE